MFPMPNSDPVRNYSLNFRKQKEVNLAWQSRRLASWRLVRTLSAFFPAKRACSHKEPFLRLKGSGKSFLPIHRMEQLCRRAVSKMVTRLVRHCDQDGRQLDAAIHWDATKSVLLKAFAKQGVRDFSDKDWLRLIHQGSSKTRFEYCEDSKNSLAYFRAIQGHSGGITIDPELMGAHSDSLQLEGVYFSQELFFQHPIYPGERTHSGWKGKQGRDDRLSSSHHSILSREDSDEEEPRDDYTIPQKVHYHSNWKRNQDAEDCNCGKRNHMQSSYTVLCQQIASTE